MRRTLVVLASVLLAVILAAPAIGQSVVGGTDGSDDKVTGQRYVRHDGGTDAGIRHCNNTASNPAADDDPTTATLTPTTAAAGARTTSRSRSSTRRTRTPWWPAGTTTA